MSFNNILVFRTGYLGDHLAALPALWNIKDTFPEARISLLTNVPEGDLRLISAVKVLPQTGLIDKIITYPETRSYGKKLRHYLTLLKVLKEGKFDCLMYLMTRSRSRGQIQRDKFFFRLAGIKKLIGFDYLEKNLLDYETKRPLPPVESEPDFLLNSLKSDVWYPKRRNKIKTDLLLDRREINFAEKWIAENCAGSDGRYKIAVAPGSKWESKIWETGNYQQVISRLIEKYDIYPVVFGGAEDREKGGKLIKSLQIGGNAAGVFTVREAAAALSKCDLYLGNDTGTMHLAASSGIPCVAVFAAVDYPGRWIPAGGRHRILRKNVSCEGCHLAVCPNGKLCLELISTDDVLLECENIILSKTLTIKNGRDS